MQDRLLRRGLAGVYVPAARVWHYVPQSRCNPDWVIQRNYRHGVEDGARAIGNVSRPRAVPPWWISFRCFKGFLRACMWSLSPDPVLRFKAKNRLSYDRGLLFGALLQNQTARNLLSQNRRAA